jgi:hypothetical protein
MSWGRWNSALGGLAGHYYQDSLCEKEFVYGKDMVDKVRKTIQKCMKDNGTTDYDPECDKDTNCDCTSDTDCGCDCDLEMTRTEFDHITMLYLVIVILAAALMFGLWGCCIRECRKKKEWVPLDANGIQI